MATPNPVIWESKLLQSKAIDSMPAENEHVLSTQFALQEQQALRQKQQQEDAARQQQAQAQAQATMAAVASAGGLANVPVTLIPHLLPAASVVTLSAPAQQAAMALPSQYLQQLTGSQTTQIAIQTNAGTAYLQIPVSVAQQLAAAQQSPGGAQQAQLAVQAVLRNAGIQFSTQPAATQAQNTTPSVTKTSGNLPQLDGPSEEKINSDEATVEWKCPGVAQEGTRSKARPVKTRRSLAKKAQGHLLLQVDGSGDTSDEDDDDDADDDDDDDDNDNDAENDDNEFEGEEEDPLNSEDDVSEEEPSELFDTDNVVVCQYDKITRSRNKWKFYLKDGIMNLQGRDFVFQKAVGDAEW
ncbi:PREDICTED: transcription initiation factor IIA subunit 1-like isoform X2 [Priapulus caudatus]|uniref:Transcription initiation factor IIA subunit 1-like isoform X2 n=1 Tax=Priapulus caudatus TaxID=37621 RepID=A0ABM1EPC4_PRICU|nr:PREDICTED: transcription initiation factor IIA subunit 1-like isoform X2 [Priapulus caudatus]